MLKIQCIDNFIIHYLSKQLEGTWEKSINLKLFSFFMKKEKVKNDILWKLQILAIYIWSWMNKNEWDINHLLVKNWFFIKITLFSSLFITWIFECYPPQSIKCRIRAGTVLHVLYCIYIQSYCPVQTTQCRIDPARFMHKCSLAISPCICP